jgi:hypothetical protein
MITLKPGGVVSYADAGAIYRFGSDVTCAGSAISGNSLNATEAPGFLGNQIWAPDASNNNISACNNDGSVV